MDSKIRKGIGWAPELLAYDPIILGWDVSGIVEAVGTKVTQFKTGDEVFGMVNFTGHGKAYAEYVAAPAAHLAKSPEIYPMKRRQPVLLQHLPHGRLSIVMVNFAQMTKHLFTLLPEVLVTLPYK